MAEQQHPEGIYQTLEDEIVTLKIRPGETISENQLCKRFGISRTPVRSALQRLEQNGFVQIIPCMYNLASNFTPAYDQSYSFTLDPDLLAQGYNNNYLLDEELDKLSMDMVYTVDSDETEKYLDMWKQFIARWNEQLPEIPLYSNVYITLYPEWLENYTQDSFWNFEQAILYATIAE